MDRPRRVAMAWYRAEEYPVLLGIFADGDRLPARHDAWLMSAEQVEGEIARSGVAVVRVEIRPDTFRDWCIAQGLKPDAAARTRYATESADRES